MGDSSNQFDLIPGLPEDVAMECLIRVPISSHNALRLVSHGWNAAVSDPSFYAERRRSGVAERLVCLIQPLSPLSPPPLAVAEEITKEDPAALVVCGGGRGGPPIYNLNVLNVSRQQWRRLSVPVPTFAQCVAVPAAGKVVVLGGWDPVTLEPVKRVVVVDLRTGTWKEGFPMPTARSFFAAAAVEVEGSTTAGVVYVAGGHDGQKNALRLAEVYDVAADEWRTLPPMSEERDESQGFSFDSTRFWVVSGYGTESQGRFRPDAEIFDPKTQTWSKIEGVWPYSSTTPKSTAASGSGPHGRMQRWWLVGGGEVKEFEWEEKRWKSVKSDPVPNSVTRSSSMSLVDMGYMDGKIFVMGNWDNCGDSREGAFMVEESENEDVTRWKTVQVPCTFMGFPFSASHLIV